MFRPHSSFPIFPKDCSFIVFPLNFPHSHDIFFGPRISSILPLDISTYTAALSGCHLAHHPQGTKSLSLALGTLEVVLQTTSETLITKSLCGRVRRALSSISMSTTKTHNITRAIPSRTQSVRWDLNFRTRTSSSGWMSCYLLYPRKDSGTHLLAWIFQARIWTTLPRVLLKKLRASLDDKNLPLLIFVNKGIETDTNALTLEIIVDTCGKDIARVSTFLVSWIRARSPRFYL